MTEFIRVSAVIAVVMSLLAGIAKADTYRFNSVSGNDWMNGLNWQNQTTGVNGWNVGGIPLPDGDDLVRFNYADRTGTLATDAGTIDALQIGVDEGGSLILNAGASLTTDTGNTSGMGLGAGTSAGFLTINDGLLTLNNGWKMGVNCAPSCGVTLEINGGEMRVVTGGFSQTYQFVTSLTTLNGGLLDVDSMTLSHGTFDVAGGTLIIRDGDKTADVAGWVADGYMIAQGGAAGAGILAVYSNGWTLVTAGAVPDVTVPDVTGLTQAASEAALIGAGLTVGAVTEESELPGNPIPGTVYSQTPLSGMSVSAGTAVDLVVVASAGPPPDTADLTPTPGNSEAPFITTAYGGRTVWETTGSKDMLYFRVPDTFDFEEGQPVYVRIEYHASGRGQFFAEYDSNLGSDTAHKFWDSERHVRSTRGGQDIFVYNYQVFESPLFNLRQNGANDFRFQLQESDGTPLRIASVQISNQPFDDEKLLLALSEPWLDPYAGPTRDFTDPNTLAGKVMTGYQGWFGTPNDVADEGWKHWGRSSGDDLDPTTITIDAWPWINEYRTEDIYPAGRLVHQDGRPAYLFSSRDPATVQRHFRWMRKHDIDGAYLQRFVSRSSSGYYGAPEFVLDNVRAAANKEGRVWAIEYDVSSLSSEANVLEVITNDWNFLVNDCDILSDPRYVHEDGKPVLFIWGFPVESRGFSVAVADEVIDWFAAKNLYLICGTRWRTEAEWQAHFRKYDELLIWMERDLGTLNSRKNTLESWGMKILPHAWPGFSWNNLKQTVFPTSYTARDGGGFYWDKLFNAVSVGADQIFLGMFDEYDEGTSIMPMSDNHPDIHTAWGNYIDNEGRDPFWWLQLSGAGREMLNGFRTPSPSLPAESAVYTGAYGGEDATAYLAGTDVSEGLAHVQVADGQTSGDFLGGHDCRTIDAGSYFYFNIDNTRVFRHAGGQRATVEIEFFDNSPGATFQLQYDSLGAAYQPHANVYTAPGFGTWRNIRWNVSDAYFGDSQNNSSDFRIVVAPGTAIRRATVFFPEEEGGVADGAAELQYADGTFEWSVLDDAVGWRLSETDNLLSNSWHEIEAPFVQENGMYQYDMALTNGAGFYQLRRPATQ